MIALLHRLIAGLRPPPPPPEHDRTVCALTPEIGRRIGLRLRCPGVHDTFWWMGPDTAARLTTECRCRCHH